MELHFIRVDNGQVLYSLKDTFKYTDRSPEALHQRSIKEITEKLATEAAEKFNPSWRYTILDKADYQLMVTNVNRDDAEIMKNLILSLPGSEVDLLIGNGNEIVMPKVFERNFYTDVGVYSILYKGPRENLLELLTSMQHPRLVVVAEKGKQIWVDQVR